MSVKLYDDALLDKLKEWTKKLKNMHIYGPGQTIQLFEVTADETGDKPIQLPIISLTRPGGYTLINPNKNVRTYDGAMTDSDEEISYTLNSIPILINYQLDIYTRKLEEADVYARELIFNIINHPTLSVIIPYNGLEREHVATIRISPNIEDNSGVPEMHLKYGQFTRFTLNIDIDDAYLWSVRKRDNVYIDDTPDIEIIQKLY